MNLYSNTLKKKKGKKQKSPLPHGDRVRITLERGTFHKAYLEGWSEEVSEPDAYKIEKIIKRKKDKNNNWIYLVKWKGYPEKFNSFINEEDIRFEKWINFLWFYLVIAQ